MILDGYKDEKHVHFCCADNSLEREEMVKIFKNTISYNKAEEFERGIKSGKYLIYSEGTEGVVAFAGIDRCKSGRKVFYKLGYSGCKKGYEKQYAELIGRVLLLAGTYPVYAEVRTVRWDCSGGYKNPLVEILEGYGFYEDVKCFCRHSEFADCKGSVLDCALYAGVKCACNIDLYKREETKKGFSLAIKGKNKKLEYLNFEYDSCDTDIELSFDSSANHSILLTYYGAALYRSTFEDIMDRMRLITDDDIMFAVMDTVDVDRERFDKIIHSYRTWCKGYNCTEDLNSICDHCYKKSCSMSVYTFAQDDYYKE